MSDFSALIASVESYIRQNGNNEITGDILQEVLVGIINTLGTQAINALESGLSTEQTTRANADTALGGRIDTEEGARQQADTALGGRIDGLVGTIGDVSGIVTTLQSRLDEGFIYKGIATPSTNPSTPTGKVFYVAVQAGTYTNFGGLTVSQGINIIKYNGSAWAVDTVVTIDDAPTEGSENFCNSAGIHNAIMLANKGFYIDNNHLIIESENPSDKHYGSSVLWDCAIIYVEGTKTIKLNGKTEVASYRYFDKADIFTGENVNENYIDKNTTGVVPEGAVVAVVNMLKTSYPNGYADFYLERDEYITDECPTGGSNNLMTSAGIHNAIMLANKGFYIDNNHLIIESENPSDKHYESSVLWDCAIIYVEGTKTIKLNGKTEVASYRYFDKADIFTGENVNENYIDKNTTGIVPDGAVVAVVNMLKTSYPNGYSNFNLERTYGKKAISILLLGNSATDDALSYVPFILQNMKIDVDIQIGILMQSDSTVQMHYENFVNESEVYHFRLFDGGDAWKQLAGTKSIQWALDNYEWDIITNQGGNADYSDRIYYIMSICNLISAYVKYPVKFAFYQTMVRPGISNGGANRSEELMSQLYTEGVEFLQNLYNTSLYDYIIPVGTAVRNAGTIPSLEVLGDYAANPNNTSNKGYLTYDGVHLQEGLPCQIAAYTFVLSLLDIYGFREYSINGETTRVTAEWESGKNIPSPHGSPIASTDENCLIAQKCAIMAMRNPFEVTDMNYIVNPT